MKARWSVKHPDGTVSCRLCPHSCVLADGKAGICQVRKNERGELTATQYGLTSGIAVDPIEKKPLYHFHPGERILSIGGYGCNLSCCFCQNSSISTNIGVSDPAPPPSLIAAAKRFQSIGVCFTYNEPLINLEYVIDTFILAREAGLKTVIVSNGYANPEPISELAPLLDAANIDIKGADDGFYKRNCRASLSPVLNTVKTLSASSHIELTYLVIPTQNDSDADFESVAKWIADNCPATTVLHFSAYHPAHRAKFPPTPLETLIRAWETAKKSLKFVFLGNVRDGEWSDTFCPKCSSPVIKRQGYRIMSMLIAGGVCKSCGAPTDYIKF